MATELPVPVEVTMSDGRSATIRAPRESDRAALLSLHDQLDDETLRLRFFNVNHAAGPHYVDHVLTGRASDVTALVAVVGGELVALGTAETVAAQVAEVAFVVAERERGHGLATLLLEHLASICRGRGITRLVADVLFENTQMAQVFDDAGYSVARHANVGVLTYEMGTERVRARGPRRPCTAHDAAPPG
ncbi:GNAT family N-acetyltransferase [Nocardioides currus]|nr:GNAT family N-acetyltransferase [Nocardioides currus]